MTQQLETQVALILLRLDVIQADVTEIKSKCPACTVTFAVDGRRIASLEENVRSLWTRFWWAVGIAVSALLGMVGTLFSIVLKGGQK